MPSTVTNFVDPVGVDYCHVTVTWPAITTYEDGSPLTVAQYEVHTSTDGVNYSLATSVPGDKLTAVLPPLLAGQSVQWKCRAIPVAGEPGDLSDPVTISMPADTTPPPVPSVPVVTSRLGTLSVAWDGAFAASAARPSDFARVEVHMGTTNGFTPSSSTLVATLPAAGAHIVSGLTYSVTRYFCMRALDVRGNASGYSAQVSGSVVPTVAADIADGTLVAAKLADNAVTLAKMASGSVDSAKLTDGAVTAIKIAAGTITANEIAGATITGAQIAATTIQAGNIATNAITADKIHAGALDAFTMTGPVIQSSAPGSGLSRWQGDTYGIHFFDSTGAATIDLDATTGQALITGKFQTAKPGTYPNSVMNATPLTFTWFEPSEGNHFEQDIGITYYTGASDATSPFVGVHRIVYSGGSATLAPVNNFVIRNGLETDATNSRIQVTPNQIQMDSSTAAYTATVGASRLLVGNASVFMDSGQPIGASMTGGQIWVQAEPSAGYGGGINMILSGNTTSASFRVQHGATRILAANVLTGVTVGHSSSTKPLTVTGSTTLAAASMSGAVTMASTLGVTGTATLGSIITTGTLAAGATTITGSLGVSAAATVGTTLGVTGLSTLAGITASGAVSLGSTLGVTGATTLSTLGTSGAVTVGTTLGVTGAATLSSTLGVSGLATLASATVSGTASLNGTTTRNNGSRTATWVNNGTSSWLTDNDPSIDTWNSFSFSGTANGGAYTAKGDYYITYDRMVHLTIYVTFSTAPTAGNAAFAGVIPAAIRPMTTPNGTAPRGAGTGPGNALCGNTINQAGQLNLIGIPAATGINAHTISYPIAKA